MCPGSLSFVKDSNVLDFTVASVLLFYRLLGIDLEHTVLDGILDLGKHIVTVAVDYLNELTYFTAGVSKLLLLTSVSTLLVVILGKSFVQDSNQRTVTGKIYCTFIIDRFVIPLIGLLNSNV